MADGAAQAKAIEYDGLVRALQKREADAILCEDTIIRLDESRLDPDLYTFLFRSIDTPIGICRVLWDEAGQPCDFQHLEVNPAYERMVDIPRDKIVGRTALEMVPELGKFWIETFGRIALMRKPGRFRHYSRSTDRWLEIDAFRLNRETFAGIFHDITETRQAQMGLLETRRQMDAVLNACGVSFWSWTIDTDRMLWSEPFARLLGCGPDETDAAYGVLLKRLHPEDRPEFERLLRAVARRPEEYRCRLRIVRPDESILPMETHGGVLADAEGRPTHIYGIVQEAAEQAGPAEDRRTTPWTQEEMEEQVRARTCELSARNRELKQRTGQLKRLTHELTQAEQRERKRLASLLHDHLQQLLVAAKFSAEGLKSDLADTAHQQTAGELSSLINESIKATKSLTMELCPPVLHETGLGAGLEWLANWMHEKHGLKVRLELGRLAEPRAQAIRIVLFESIRELLFNVVKHAGVKEAWVEANTLSSEHLRIVVRDEGKGFDPVRMLQGTEQSNGGFGLFSIRQRLELLGGRLEIDSRIAAGSRVCITSPIREIMPAETEVTPISAEEVADGPSTDAPQPPRIRVLIADDHMIMRQGLSLLLNREEDILVAGEARDGGEAVKLTEQLRPDAVIMDLRMPNMDGIEATRQIRRRMPAVRILAFSDHEERETIAQALDAGASAFVHKGRRLDTLLTVLRSISLPVPTPAGDTPL